MSFFHAWASLCFFYSRAATRGGIQTPRAYTLVTFALSAFHLPSSIRIRNVRAACISIITWCKSFLLLSVIKPTMFAQISSRCWESSLTTLTLLYCKHERHTELHQKQADHEPQSLAIRIFLPYLLLRLTCVSLDVRPPSSDLLGLNTKLTGKRNYICNRKEAVCTILLCKASEYTSSVKDSGVQHWLFRLLASQEGPVQNLCLESRGCVVPVVCRALLRVPTSPHPTNTFAFCRFFIKAQTCLVLIKTYIIIVGRRMRYLISKTSSVIHSARTTPGRVWYVINSCSVKGLKRMSHFVKYFATCELTIQMLTDDKHKIHRNGNRNFNINSLFQIVLHKYIYRHFLQMYSVKWKTLRCHQRQLKLKDVFTHSNQAIIQVMNFGSSVLHEGDNNFWQLKSQQRKRHTLYKEQLYGTSSKKFRQKLQESQTWAKCTDDRQSQKTVLKYQDHHRKQWFNVINDQDHDEKVQKEVKYYRQYQNLQMGSILHYHRHDAQPWIVHYRRHQNRETGLTNNDQKTEGCTHLEKCVIQQAGNSSLRQISLPLSNQIAKLLVLTPTSRLPQAQTTDMYTGHHLNGNTKLTQRMQDWISRTNMTRHSHRVTRQVNVTHTARKLNIEHATQEDMKKHAIVNVLFNENRARNLSARSSAAWGAIGQKRAKSRSTACGHREHQERGIIRDRSYGDLHAEETAGLYLRCCSTAGQVGEAEGTTIAHRTSSSKRNYTSPSSNQKQPNVDRVCCSQSRIDCARTSLLCKPTPSIIIRLTLCSLLFCAPFAVSSSPVVVGVYVQNRESPQALAFFNRTVDVMLNRVKKMLPNQTFIVKMIFESCSSVETLDKFIDMNQRLYNPVDVFIGPTCNWICNQLINLTKRWTSAIISYKSCGHLESNTTLNRNFLRAMPSFQEKINFFKEVMKRFRWEHVTIVTAQESYSEWSERANMLKNVLKQENSITVLRWMVELTHEDSVIASAEQKIPQSYVFVWLMFPEEVIRFHELLYTTQLFRQGYAFFTFDFANYAMVTNISTAQLFNMTGLLDITIDSLQDTKKYDEFVSQISAPTDVFRLPCKRRAIGIALSEFADAILLMGHCIKLTQRTNSSKKCDLRNLYNKTFKGATSDVRIDKNGFRVEKLMLSNLVSGCYFQVGWFNYGHSESVTFNLSSSVIWPGDTNQLPTVKPACGWNNEECGLQTGHIITIGVSIVLGAVGISLCVFLFRRIKARQELGKTDWIISASKLYASPIIEGKAGAITGSTKHWTKKDTKSYRGRLWSLVSQDSFKGISGNPFTKVAVINGQLVAVKPVMKESLVVTKDITKEFNKIRRLKHSNVNPLIGACVEMGHISLVWGYCHKGSLENVLLHAGIKLDVIFNVSFISDIVRGMTYLHDSPVGRHGRLKSSNVIVDSNWSCRITDIAMPYFREGEVRSHDEHPIPCFDLLWMAPELLYDVALQRRGTKKGDVYAFAIIMQEIILRSRPFGISEDDSAREIVQRVRKRESPSFRPVVPRSAADENILHIMYLCWDDFELFRPTFPVISEMIKHVRGGLGTTTSLVDQMLHMLSKYADNLEELVEERTTQLELEQKKTEELLCRMLPKSVAMNLKLGNEVVPESFNAVTIYFSDIVGFTSLAASSTPMQVVDLLNDLYTCFDTIIESFDVYKVETIGDAYMVVSGLPVRNGNLHAGEIATMALKIVSSVVTFRIRHLPGEQLNIRIGIHTGPVVAGVVGLKMPRYCLFGDTVNYASRMESTGVPQRVHVSPECKAYLDVLGGFIFEERGPVEMKGKGVINTFFLVGRVAAE